MFGHRPEHVFPLPQPRAHTCPWPGSVALVSCQGIPGAKYVPAIANPTVPLIALTKSFGDEPIVNPKIKSWIIVDQGSIHASQVNHS